MTKVCVEILKSGFCLGNRNKTLVNSKSKIQKFNAGFALIEHPIKGKILFDTGYSNHFFEAVKKFPYSLYAKITPVTLEDEPNLPYDEIKYIIISHFHADHISGLKNFNNAKFICSQDSYDFIKNKTGFKAVLNGFLPELLPEDFEKRLLFIEDISNKINNEIFNCCYDIFQDESIIAVDIEGHAKGQIGIIIDSNIGKKFLIADACWNSLSYKKNVPPPNCVLNFLGNRKKYLETLNKIHNFYKLNPDIEIYPSHCPIIWGEENE